MRENMGLFRGKLIDQDEWVVGYYVRLYDSKGNASHRIYPGYAETDCGDFYPDWYEVDPDTVGECTVLKDKNGKLVFEGDIVETTKYGKDSGKGANFSGPDRFIVEFFDGGYHPTNKWRRFNLRPDVDMKIIGNIFDNPELLETDNSQQLDKEAIK